MNIIEVYNESPILFRILFLDKQMIIFDLDETLIHCTDGPHQSAEVYLSVPWPDGRILNVNCF